MRIIIKMFPIVIVLMISALLPGCKKDDNRNSAKEEQIKEIMPGLLQGYLSKEELPNSLALIPPPPEQGTLAFELDQQYAKKAVESKDHVRFIQAKNDADLSFPSAIKCFEAVRGIEISETKTPKLYILMRRVLTDAGLATYSAKNHYNRKRPFVINNTHTCTPGEETALRKDGSYPSGHTSVGWAWALVLCEIYPEKANAILQRGYAFGESRVLCNVHWHSDVESGRIVGAAVVGRLHANPDFQKDLTAAKEEVKKLSVN